MQAEDLEKENEELRRRLCESEQRHQQLSAELADTRLLQQISAELIHEDDIDVLYQKLVETAVGVMHADFGSMQMLFPDRGEPGTGGELLLLAQSGFTPEATRHWEWVRASSTCSCGEAFRTRKRAIVDDVANCGFMTGTPDRAAYLAAGILAAQSTPLMSRSGKMLGMISTHWRTPHHPPERDLRLFDVVARQATDLIERVQAEQALRVSEERFRRMADAVPVLIWVSDLSKGCTWFNKCWLDFTGRSMSDLIGNGWAADVHPDDFDRCLHTYTTHFDARLPFVMEYRLRRYDGEYRWFVDTGMPAFDHHGAFTGYVGSCVDFTDRKRAEAELRQIADDLSDADRRKNEFLALLAHELRNPLAPIRNAVHILRVGSGAPNAIPAATDLLERQVSQMVRLVDDLLDISRITLGKIELRRQQVVLTSAIEHAVEAVRPLLQRMNHDLTLSIPAEAIVLDADGARLSQVVANLLNNACKFTEPGGRIALTVSREGDSAVIRVRDNGIGIAEDQLATIFEMFMQIDKTLERTQSGLGIGLTLVKNLVEMHGGTICVHSSGAGTGTEFVVRLPAVPAPVMLPRSAPRILNRDRQVTIDAVR